VNTRGTQWEIIIVHLTGGEPAKGLPKGYQGREEEGKTEDSKTTKVTSGIYEQLLRNKSGQETSGKE